MNESILGARADRVKTTIEIPKEFAAAMDTVCAALRIPRNVFFVIAGSMLVIELSPLINGRKRAQMVDAVESVFEKIVNKIRKQL